MTYEERLSKLSAVGRPKPLSSPTNPTEVKAYNAAFKAFMAKSTEYGIKASDHKKIPYTGNYPDYSAYTAAINGLPPYSEPKPPKSQTSKTPAPSAKKTGSISASSYKGSFDFNINGDIPVKGSFTIRPVIEPKGSAQETEKLVREGLLSMTNEILENANETLEDGYSVAFYTIYHGRNQLLSKAIATGQIEVDQRSAHGEPLIVFASRVGNFDAVRQLIVAGADINAKDKSGRSALFWSAQNRGVQTANHLLRAGVDVDSKSKGLSLQLGYCELNLRFGNIDAFLGIDCIGPIGQFSI